MKVHVVYAQEDLSLIVYIKSQLVNDNIHLWVQDIDAIGSDNRRGMMTQKTILESTAAIFVQSHNSNKSLECESQLRLLMSLNKPVVVVKLDETENAKISNLEAPIFNLSTNLDANLKSLRDYLLRDVEESTSEKDPKSSSSRSVIRESLLEMPTVSFFKGRTTEVNLLTSWLEIGSKMIVVEGMGGIGKTTLVAKFVGENRSSFECSTWKSMKNAPPLRNLLFELIDFVDDSKINNNLNNDELILVLMDLLKKHTCLIVLDNYESLMDTNKKSGLYRDDYQDYAAFIERLGSTDHRSLILITTRERPNEIKKLSTTYDTTKSLRLSGIDAENAKSILSHFQLQGSDKNQSRLVQIYEGNPLALKLLAGTIRDIFNNNIDEFLGTNTLVFGDIKDLIAHQFDRINETEEKLIYWLAIEREPVSLDVLQNNFVEPATIENLLDTIISLQNRSLIEKENEISAKFTMQNVVMEYATSKFIEKILNELTGGKIHFFDSHALAKARTKDYIRSSQVRVILKPIIQNLSQNLDDSEISSKLIAILNRYRTKPLNSIGYVAGNIINMLIEMGIDLSGMDFSHLNVREGYFRDILVRDVNFSYSKLDTCVFNETFGAVLGVAYSNNSKYFAVASTNTEVRIWDAENIRQMYVGAMHKNWVRSVAFTSNDRILASCGDDCTIHFWDPQTGYHIKKFGTYKSRLFCIRFTPDDKYIITSSDDRAIQIWDVESEKILKVLEGHNNWIWDIDISKDGKLLASAGFDGMVGIWDLEKGELIRKFVGHTKRVNSVSFNYSGELVASGSSDKTVRVWSVHTGACTNTYEEHGNWIWSIEFAHNNNLLASSADDGKIIFIDIDRNEIIKSTQSNSGMVREIHFSKDDRVLISGSEEQKVQLWDTETGQCIRTLQGHTNRIRSVEFSPRDLTFASGSSDSIVRIWDLKTGKNRELRGHSDRVRCVTHNLSGDRAASSGVDNTIKIWDNLSGVCITTLTGHQGPVRVAKYLDNRILVSAGEDKSIKYWDTETSKCINTLHGHVDRIWALDINRDLNFLASGSSDHTIRIWHSRTGDFIRVIDKHVNAVRALAFWMDGVLASAGDDPNIYLWNVVTGENIATLSGHQGPIWALAFNKRNSILASASSDQTILLWDTKTHKQVGCLTGHTNWVNSLSFSFDGNLLISGSDDETIMVWDMNKYELANIYKCDGPYLNMNIKNVKGLTEAQRLSLKSLGATTE